jgi:hypothetical protein
MAADNLVAEKNRTGHARNEAYTEQHGRGFENIILLNLNSVRTGVSKHF